jgi:hypothetical protein
LDKSRIGDLLTGARIDLVERHHRGSVVDIGIGGGRFVATHPNARGFDINPNAVAWLRQMDRWSDPYDSVMEAATFWDSLEHMHDPRPILRNVRRFCFVSLPIFWDCDHVLRSKHFKPQEHCWYFTRGGIGTFMAYQGFRMIETSLMEQACGREDIESFVFERV